MARHITIEPLTSAAFAPFGQVIETSGAQHYPINNGMTERYHDLARVELGGVHPRPLISIFHGQPYALPLTLKLVERHPLGSQAFMPLQGRPFLVAVAPPGDFDPAKVRIFRAAATQGVNYARGTWHHFLLAVEAESDFLVIDREGGPGENLDEVELSEADWIAVPL